MSLVFKFGFEARVKRELQGVIYRVRSGFEVWGISAKPIVENWKRRIHLFKGNYKILYTYILQYNHSILQP